MRLESGPYRQLGRGRQQQQQHQQQQQQEEKGLLGACHPLQSSHTLWFQLCRSMERQQQQQQQQQVCLSQLANNTL
jgi:hypothetical protein